MIVPPFWKRDIFNPKLQNFRFIFKHFSTKVNMSSSKALNKAQQDTKGQSMGLTGCVSMTDRYEMEMLEETWTDLFNRKASWLCILLDAPQQYALINNTECPIRAARSEGPSWRMPPGLAWPATGRLIWSKFRARQWHLNSGGAAPKSYVHHLQCCRGKTASHVDLRSGYRLNSTANCNYKRQWNFL